MHKSKQQQKATGTESYGLVCYVVGFYGGSISHFVFVVALKSCQKVTLDIGALFTVTNCNV